MIKELCSLLITHYIVYISFFLYIFLTFTIKIFFKHDHNLGNSSFKEGKLFYLVMHSTHVIYGLDIL